MNLNDIKLLTKDYLTPNDVCGCLGCAAYNINVQVREDKQKGVNSFPFPTILIKSRVKIPRIAFIKAMEGISDDEVSGAA